MITVQIKDEGLAPALDNIARALADMTPLMGDLGQQFVRSSKDRIKAGVTPTGAPFAPRSSATLAAYERWNSSYGGVLQRSGDLMADLVHQPGPDRVSWGSNAVYAAVMQMGAAKGAFGATRRGGPIPWGAIPARPYLGLSDQDRTDALDIIAEWLERAARGGR